MHVKDWNLFLPFVLIPYQSRVHSATGFTPFELIYLPKMIPFNHWTDEDDNANAILERGLEIRHMIENTRPQALENLKKFQERQIETQNKSQYVAEERIEI